MHYLILTIIEPWSPLRTWALLVGVTFVLPMLIIHLLTLIENRWHLHRRAEQWVLRDVERTDLLDGWEGDR